MKPMATRLLDALAKSKIYADYERAFTEATGLPLTLRAPDMIQIAHQGEGGQNSFCSLMAKSNQSCAACHAMQAQLEREAGLRPRTLKCFAGFCETAVPVRVGNNLVAFLHTGQILVQPPSKKLFSEVANALIGWGAEVDLKRAEEAWFATRVLTPEQYDALVRMLSIFARHLETCGNALAIQQKEAEPPSIRRARAFVAEHSADDVTLSEVARAVNMSAHYLSEKFRQSTGLTFTEYVARVRIEKARNLLQNPNLSVSEIAYDVGFQSLSQFNRAFRRFVGKAPTQYRRELSAA
jgi:AraC-like DNA-binding protein